MDAEAAYDKVIRLLAQRSHSRAELVRKLRRRGVSKAVASEAVDRAAEQGYVNDAEFALLFAEQAQGRGLAPARIRRELATRGVEAQHVEAALKAAFGEVDLGARALELARQRLPRLSGEAESVRRRLAAFLKRRGFPTHVIIDALDAVAPPGEPPYIGRAQ